MDRPFSSALVAGLVLAVFVGTPLLRCAEEKPAPPAGNAPQPVPPQDPPPTPPPAPAPAPAPAPSPEGSPADPAGMVRFPGGKAKIGMSRKALEALVKGTEIGGMRNMDKLIEDGYSISCPEFEVTLPPFWIGKYEVTNAQYHRFLQAPENKVVCVVPAKGKPGATTLEQIARQFMLAPEFDKSGGGKYYPVANDWKALYELNEEVVNPVVEGQDPKTRPAPETYQNRALPAGTRILAFRWSVPLTWRAKPGGRLLPAPPPWMEEMPVSTVSWADAMACAGYYGCHLPTEMEWEAACRGPKGEIWPEGGTAMDPLAHAWKGFTNELLKAQEKYKKEIAGAKKRLADAKGDQAVADARAELDLMDEILKAREIPEDPPFTVVGSFPRGRSPCGAMDMIGNVEEWVSTALFRYPGTDTQSKWADADARILRGGNTIYRDTLLTCTFRAIVYGDLLLMKHMKFATAGFRMARYETPGASAASHIVGNLKSTVPAILPREEERGTHRLIGPDLDIYRATGFERLNEVSWTAARSPKNDPAGKVFHLAPAQSLCVIPATGIPYRDAAAIKEAASSNPVPSDAARQANKADNRKPRDIPFLGALHMTHGITLKGEKRVEKWVEVPLTPKEIKERQNAAKERKKQKEKEDKEKEKGKEEGPKDDDGGKDPAPPKEKMEGGSGGKDKGGKGGKGGKGKEGEKPEDGAPPADAPEEDPPEPDPDEEKIPTTRKEFRTVHEKGFIGGAEYVDGLLLGFVKIGEDFRPALWEPRLGTVGSLAPGGTVLLESPLVILPKDSMVFKKVGKAGAPNSTFSQSEGIVTLTFYIPVEGKDTSAWIETTLTLKVDFAPDWTGGPWKVTGSALKESPKAPPKDAVKETPKETPK